MPAGRRAPCSGALASSGNSAPNLLVEAAYVGNRGVWWQANTLIAPNALTSQILAAHGLSLNNPADLKLLATPLESVAGRQSLRRRTLSRIPSRLDSGSGPAALSRIHNPGQLLGS